MDFYTEFEIFGRNLGLELSKNRNCYENSRHTFSTQLDTQTFELRDKVQKLKVDFFKKILVEC